MIEYRYFLLPWTAAELTDSDCGHVVQGLVANLWRLEYKLYSRHTGLSLMIKVRPRALLERQVEANARHLWYNFYPRWLFLCLF